MTGTVLARLEGLEPRRLFSSVYPNVNVSRTAGNHAEGTIVVDPTDPSRLFTASNAPGTGLLAATSSDGGATWTRRLIAGDAAAGSQLSPDGLAPACCDPSAAFDRFGNLYLTYAHDADHGVEVIRSTDHGATFSHLATFQGDLDQPTVTTGADSVWVTAKRGGSVAAFGAAVSGLGSATTFSAPMPVPGSRGGNFGDIAVGASGQVAVTYQQGAKIGVNVDPDGLGPAKFGRRVPATKTKVGGFDSIAGQNSRGIDAEATLAFDRSTASGFGGRLYLMYTDEQPDGSDNTDIYLRYSPDNGATWSTPVRAVPDTTLASQFLPRMVVDDSIGDVYLGWYDTRNDTGGGGADDTNGTPNDDAEYFVNRLRPAAEGMLVGTPVQVSQAASNAAAADSSIDLGDYTGLAVQGGVIYPLWADNSNSTGDNPDGAGKNLDQYTARVTSPPALTSRALGNLPGGFQAVYTPPRSLFLGGKSEYRFRVTYSAPGGIDVSSLGDDLLVGGAMPASFVSSRTLRRTGEVVATYSFPAPNTRFTRDDNGTYAITLVSGAVRDASGAPQLGGEIGSFAVKTSLSST